MEVLALRRNVFFRVDFVMSLLEPLLVISTWKMIIINQQTKPGQRIPLKDHHYEQCSKSGISRNIWNPKEREDRRQMKKRKIFHSRLRVITEKERLDADVPRSERATHVFVKEQVMFYSPGMINSGSRNYRPV